jgi:dTDP-glucose pyrophosphorylase
MEEFLSTQLLPIEIVRQSAVVGDRYGSGSVIEAAASVLTPDEPFVFLNGDSLFPAAVLHALCINDGFNHVLVAPHDHPEHYGVIDMDETGKLRAIIEKPAAPTSNLINLGLYVCQPALVATCRALVPSPRGEYELTDALTTLAQTGQVVCDQWTGDWVDYGKPEDLSQVETFITQHLQ